MSDDDNIEDSTPKKHLARQFFDNIFIPVGVAIISLGSFSEAFILVDDFIIMVKSKLSHEFEYELLEDIHVGNTLNYVEDIMGAPAVVKRLNDTIEAKYYFNEKFLLTGYYEGERVSAYTVIALKSDFSPEVPWDEDKRLGEHEFVDYVTQTTGYSFDNANTNRFFIESASTELKGFFQSAYLGTIQYGKGELQQPLLDEIYNAEVFASDEEAVGLIENFRSKTEPNLYGQGELDIEVIHKGLLSNGEFLNFFGAKD